MNICLKLGFILQFAKYYYCQRLCFARSGEEHNILASPQPSAARFNPCLPQHLRSCRWPTTWASTPRYGSMHENCGNSLRIFKLFLRTEAKGEQSKRETLVLQFNCVIGPFTSGHALQGSLGRCSGEHGRLPRGLPGELVRPRCDQRDEKNRFIAIGSGCCQTHLEL